MRIWYNNILDNTRYALDVRGNRIRIGRNSDNDIVLNSPFIASEAAVLYGGGGNWELVVLGSNGCQIDDREIRGGGRCSVGSGQVINLFPFTLTLEFEEQVVLTPDESRQAHYQEMIRLMQVIHLDLLGRMDLETSADTAREQSDDYLLSLERNIEDIARGKGLCEPARTALVNCIAGHCVRSELLGELLASANVKVSGLAAAERHWSRIVSTVPEREQELRKTVKYVATHLGLPQITDLTAQSDRVEEQFWPVWEQIAANVLYEDFQHFLAFRFFKKEIKDIVFGYGPLEDLLRTPAISEIMVVDPSHIYIEKNGVLENSGRRFLSDEVTLAIIERIVSRVGRRIDKSSPLVDARLEDGSRVNAVVPPLAVSGPCLTIRKFPLRRLHMDDLVAKGALTPTVAKFLQACVLTRRNILISGGTGTGKTTLLNCLSDYIPDKERIVTVEDTAELQLHKEHVVRMETKSANIEGAGAYTIRDLVRNALRMRPDRVVVGECRGAEALDMLQAMNTGHDGSMTTLHANTSADVVLRLEVLVQMAANLSMDSIHRQIASAIDLVVQLTRCRDGSRRISQITQFVGIDPERGGIRAKDIFALDEHDGSTVLHPTGSLPTFMDELIESGLVQLETIYR
ncbi:MAG: Flp pilus assembly complex ATPase component TadA [Gemmataceae bacterium]|nr:Flp pilus assembly complex ATPase component TadA [Gemmataceae bacterium]